MCASVRNVSNLEIVCSCLNSGVCWELVETEEEEEQAETELSSGHRHYLKQCCVLWLVAPSMSLTFHAVGWKWCRKRLIWTTLFCFPLQICTLVRLRILVTFHPTSHLGSSSLTVGIDSQTRSPTLNLRPFECLYKSFAVWLLSEQVVFPQGHAFWPFYMWIRGGVV